MMPTFRLAIIKPNLVRSELIIVKMNIIQSEVQHNFLSRLQKSNQSISIFLKSGIQLRGNIASFDDFIIILSKDNTDQMVYKHAISTICLTQISNDQRQHNIDRELIDFLAKSEVSD